MLSYPRLYSHNEKMQLVVVFSNGGDATGKMTILLKGRAASAGSCTLAPTGGWDTYKTLSCGGASRYSADTRTGMMPDISFNFSGDAAEFARIDSFQWQIYD